MQQPLHPALHALAALGEMRVWSLVVTIFGDAVVPRGGVVPASALQAILERMAIKPEAMRVALHRLVKDGWIARQRSGRQSFYGLTPRGEAEFLAASKRIYATGPVLHDPWRLMITNAPLERGRPDLIPVAPNAYLGSAGAVLPVGAISVSGTVDQVPDWVSAALAPDPLGVEFEELYRALQATGASDLPEAADAAALRILIVHQWRRLLLRHPDLPAAFFPEGWRGEACRAMFLELHAALSEAADPWLDAAIIAPDARAAE